MPPASRPASHLSDFFTGLALPVRALRMIFGGGKLLALSLLCFALTAITLIGLLVLLAPVASWITAHWIAPGGFWRSLLGGALTVLVYLTLAAIGLLTVPNLLLAPLQDPLSEATEEKLGNFSAPPFSVAGLVKGTGTSLLHTIWRLVLMLFGFAVLLPLNLIPVAGTVLYGVLSAMWAMWWVCAEYLSGPMARHLLPFSAVLRAMWDRPGLALGMGATLYVVLWVPVINCFLVPLAVVAGTLLFRAMPPAASPGT